ncbi:clusterin-associated protein 1-like isoform X2 [Sycon ciliatum]|uniref:clusterin-associated protein 1-like isoform X2 n=1 Tax=Sycon ciliatum TaxID=27933 RepID=UPI0031F71BD3
MPFYEMRALREHLWYLDYPRQLSIESFRNPNFPLVAEMLQWFTTRYQDDPGLPVSTENEHDRTFFITTHVEFLFKESGIKLNPRRLYSADGHCVQELLKVASSLRKAMEAAKNYNPEEESSATGFVRPTPQELAKLMEDQKKVREMASELTERGARLYDLLGRETELREQRETALSKELDMREIEAGMKRCIESLMNNIQHKQKMIDELASDESDLLAKITRKKEELKRAGKRMRALKNVRPAFMDDFDKLETVMRDLYEVYVGKFRNVKFLESKVAEINKEEQEKYLERARELQAIQEQAHSQQQESLLAGVAGADGVIVAGLGDDDDEGDDDDDDDEDDDEEETSEEIDGLGDDIKDEAKTLSPTTASRPKRPPTG